MQGQFSDSFGVLHLASLWGAFKLLHPQLVLDVTLNDGTVDMVDEGYDLAIRIARMSDSSLINRWLAGTRMVLCASSEYLRKHGTPAHPNELLEHAFVHFSNCSARDEWGSLKGRKALSL